MKKVVFTIVVDDGDEEVEKELLQHIGQLFASVFSMLYIAAPSIHISTDWNPDQGLN
jgi:hypothetical protein